MEQVLHLAEGERIGDDELEIVLLADLEEIGVDWVRSAPGRDAPPAHVHPNHSQCFLVLEGELTFRLEDRELQARPDTWVLVPPYVVHTFTATGEEPARFLDIHVPGSGLGAFVRGLASARDDEELRAVRAAFDQRPAPEYATADPGLVVLRRAGGIEGEPIGDRAPTRRATLLVDADELTVSEFSYGAGERGAKPHVHRHHADVFIVVDGEFTFAYRDGSIVGPAGTLFVFPPGVVHGFDNSSEAAARCFNLHVPASGFAEYLRGRNPDFDQHDPPADGGADPASIVAVRFP